MLPSEARAEDLSTEVAPHEIVGGQTTSDYEAVVALTAGDKLCTGALVSPSVVLTAAHCLVRATDVEVHFGPRQDIGGGVAAARWGTHPRYCSDCREERFDFGFVVLPDDASIEPFHPVGTQSEIDETLWVGGEVVLLGFGAADPTSRAGDLGVKRVVSTEITGLSTHGLEFVAGGTGHDTCSGDSGGPALARLAGGELRLLGVTSRGAVPCGAGGRYGVAYPALCWLALETGADLRRDGCGTCDCIDLPRADDSPSCSVAPRGRSAAQWAWLLPTLLLWVRRRRASVAWKRLRRRAK